MAAGGRVGCSQLTDILARLRHGEWIFSWAVLRTAVAWAVLPLPAGGGRME